MATNSVAQSKMPRAFIVPNGNAYPLRSYLNAWRMVKAADPETVTRGWQWFPVTAAEIRRDIWRGVEDRINLRGELPMHGRKWSADWQRAARYCAREVNTPRLIVRYVPADFRARLAHRIYRDD